MVTSTKKLTCCKHRKKKKKVHCNHGNKHVGLPDFKEDEYTNEEQCQYTKCYNIKYDNSHATGGVKQSTEPLHNTVFFLWNGEWRFSKQNLYDNLWDSFKNTLWLLKQLKILEDEIHVTTILFNRILYKTMILKQNNKINYTYISV